MKELTTFRLYLLRAMYLFMAAGLAVMIWPLLLTRTEGVEHMRGVVWSLLGGLSLMAALGIRYPVRMLPILIFELTWKVIWVGLIGLPLWSSGQLDRSTGETLFNCLLGVVMLPLVIPWPYVFSNYVRAPGDRWRGRPAEA